MTVKTSISLTDQQEAYARSLVQRGDYPSLSAVLQRGLEMLRRENEEREAELEAMRRFFDERAKGPFVSLEDGEAQLRALRAKRRKALASL